MGEVLRDGGYLFGRAGRRPVDNSLAVDVVVAPIFVAPPSSSAASPTASPQPPPAATRAASSMLRGEGEEGAVGGGRSRTGNS